MSSPPTYSGAFFSASFNFKETNELKQKESVGDAALVEIAEMLGAKRADQDHIKAVIHQAG